VVFIIANNYFKVKLPQVIGVISDLVEDYSDSPVRTDALNEQVFSQGLVLVGWFLLFAIISTIFLFFTRQTIIVMSRLIEYDLKNDIYKKYQDLSYSFYKVNSTGDIMNRISEDVTYIRMYLGPAIMYSINVLFLFVFVIYAMYDKSPMLTFYVLAPLPLMSFIIYKVSILINKKSQVTQKQQSKLTTFVQEAFSGIRVLKAFDRGAYFQGEFDKSSVDYKNAALSLAKTNALFFPVILLLIGMSTIITIYAGGMQVIAGNLDIGDIAEFIIYVNMLTWPFAAIGWVSSMVQRASASQERVNEFMEVKKEIVEIENPISESLKELEFKNVSFTYPNTGVTALKNINFKLEQGKVLAITGRTGSGKSTLSILIERLYDISEGEILINSKNIKDFEVAALRKQIGFVPQDVFLFSDTIAGNISFGLDQEEVSNDQTIQAAKDAHIHHNIIDFENGYETKVGERGITLSVGQKQRVSIARAIIRNPRLLIFDDCLSAVDTDTEDIILKNLKRIMKGKMSIIIGHRISSIKHADMILVLDKGEIVERGDHSSLLNQKGMYAEMYEKQLVEEK